MKFEVFSAFILQTPLFTLSLVRVAQHLREANAGGMIRANNARVNQVTGPVRVQSEGSCLASATPLNVRIMFFQGGLPLHTGGSNRKSALGREALS